MHSRTKQNPNLTNENCEVLLLNQSVLFINSGAEGLEIWEKKCKCNLGMPPYIMNGRLICSNTHAHGNCMGTAIAQAQTDLAVV